MTKERSVYIVMAIRIFVVHSGLNSRLFNRILLIIYYIILHAISSRSIRQVLSYYQHKFEISNCFKRKTSLF